MTFSRWLQAARQTFLFLLGGAVHPHPSHVGAYFATAVAQKTWEGEVGRGESPCTENNGFVKAVWIWVCRDEMNFFFKAQGKVFALCSCFCFCPWF